MFAVFCLSISTKICLSKREWHFSILHFFVRMFRDITLWHILKLNWLDPSVTKSRSLPSKINHVLQHNHQNFILPLTTKLPKRVKLQPAVITSTFLLLAESINSQMPQNGRSNLLSSPWRGYSFSLRFFRYLFVRGQDSESRASRLNILICDIGRVHFKYFHFYNYLMVIADLTSVLAWRRVAHSQCSCWGLG